MCSCQLRLFRWLRTPLRRPCRGFVIVSKVKFCPVWHWRIPRDAAVDRQTKKASGRDTRFLLSNRCVFEREGRMRREIAIGLLAGLLFGVSPASGAEIKVLTAGAFKSIVVALAPDFEQQTGHKVSIEN